MRNNKTEKQQNKYNLLSGYVLLETRETVILSKILSFESNEDQI